MCSGGGHHIYSHLPSEDDEVAVSRRDLFRQSAMAGGAAVLLAQAQAGAQQRPAPTALQDLYAPAASNTPRVANVTIPGVQWANVRVRLMCPATTPVCRRCVIFRNSCGR
jgi:hypothetical protein